MIESPLKRRLRFLQTLCRGLIIGVIGINVVVGMIVWYALDGVPLAGHRFTVGGVSMMTVVAAVLTFLIPAVSLWVAKTKSRTALTEHPGQVIEAFALKTGIEFLPIAGTGFVWAIFYHITAERMIWVLVACLLAYLFARFPTTKRANAWFAKVTLPTPS